MSFLLKAVSWFTTVLFIEISFLPYKINVRFFSSYTAPHLLLDSGFLRHNSYCPFLDNIFFTFNCLSFEQHFLPIQPPFLWTALYSLKCPYLEISFKIMLFYLDSLYQLMEIWHVSTVQLTSTFNPISSANEQKEFLVFFNHVFCIYYF